LRGNFQRRREEMKKLIGFLLVLFFAAGCVQVDTGAPPEGTSGDYVTKAQFVEIQKNIDKQNAAFFKKLDDRLKRLEKRQKDQRKEDIKKRKEEKKALRDEAKFKRAIEKAKEKGTLK